MRKKEREIVRVFTPHGELLTEAAVLHTFWAKFFGLAFKSLPEVSMPAILFPCGSVHTFFMRFPIDLFFLAKNGDVLKIIRNLPPNRVVPPVKGATFVMEAPSETFQFPDISYVSIPNLIENRF